MHRKGEAHWEHRSSRSALFDDLEEGGLRTSSSVEIKEHDNDKALHTLEDRVSILKRVLPESVIPLNLKTSMLKELWNG
ncbi:bet1-like SNARE 1-2 isoform X2 [Cucumis melo var. makuwa]|uniref:Bet1-like SNARE 1-2 isoform X2 n=1 Tax=Cucumis melo var. makuwa TaxID=1194695 RepID=A0A5D3CBG8_CUCMM|nr:bet1-like SNARE 1-2 isoform X2 [Cucumis melo var. makuwa]TYK08538.1 bet1-like SNARE 1-2 isoform X2 [Cucumis melo var. makuwa]